MQTRTALVGTLVFVLTACAAKETAANAKPDSATAAPAAAVATAVPNVVTVHAKDFAYSGAPAQIPAGVTTFRLINDGPNLHHMEIVRLDSGRTLANLEEELAKPAAPPTWAVFQGGPNAPAPGTEANATLDLQPGNYVMLCLVDLPGHVPHFTKGMVHAFTVTAPAAGAQSAAPAPDVTLTLADYTFDLSKPLTAGQHTFAVKNAGTQMHEVELVQLAPGKTLAQLMSWLDKPNGPPPGTPIGGVSPFVGAPIYFTVDVKAGNYALICFVPDAKDGKPHFMHGMTKAITVS
jgi:hypothetical protein